MRLPTWTPKRAALAGACVGVLLTLVAAAIAWPDDASTGADEAPAVDVPTVPPAPDPTELASASSSASPTEDEGSADESDEDEGGDGDEYPDSAPLVADAPPAGEGSLPDAAPVSCPGATITVTDGGELSTALAEAQPGDVIELDDGTYAGNFATTASGSEDDPIYLCGSSGAVLDGGDIEGDYALHLDGASYWRLVGFTVSGGQKGVVADGTVGSVIQDLTVTGTGDEAIHLRTHSTDNVVSRNTISDTGNRRDKYGEGVYIGSAVSNWCTYTDCEADRSDRNVVVGNTISDVTTEAIDIKEGTTGGLVADNTFDGSGMTDGDSWVDVKGNNYLIEGNEGSSSSEDGFQTHQILDGWGDFNVFAANHADVGGPGFGIASWPEESNVVHCDNTVEGAAEGLSNIPCS